MIIATATIELSIPLLLILPATRRAGVLLALAFHAVLALDQSHQFFDFSSALFALFFLFLPSTAGTWVIERIGSMRARLALRSERLPERVHLALVALAVIAGLAVSLDALTRSMALEVGWWPWQLYAAGVIVLVARFSLQDRSRASVRLVPHHPLFLLVPLVVVLNGLSPYLELKTGYAWNMYSNLRTVDGETNHLLLPRTFPLTDEQDDPVRIIDTNAGGLAYYAARDYGLTWRQLQTYLADRPGVAITYERGGERVALERAGDRSELVEPVPPWREKLQLFRAIDLTSPERCVPAFGPAR